MERIRSADLLQSSLPPTRILRKAHHEIYAAAENRFGSLKEVRPLQEDVVRMGL